MNWPKSDKFVASPKNDGVTATDQADAGRHRLHRVRFAKFAKLEMAQLQNTRRPVRRRPAARAGPRRSPASQLPAEPARRGSRTPRAPKAYPIATYTWMLFYKENKDPKKAAALRKMVEYCLTDGQKMARQMGYIPLPEPSSAAVAEGIGAASSEPRAACVDPATGRHRERRSSIEPALRAGPISRPPSRGRLPRRPRVSRRSPQAGRLGSSCCCSPSSCGRSAARRWPAIRDYGLGFLTSTDWDVRGSSSASCRRSGARSTARCSRSRSAASSASPWRSS